LAYKFLIALFVIFNAQCVCAEEMCATCHADKIHYKSIGSCIVCHNGNGNTSRIKLAHENILDKRYAFFLIKDNWRVFKGNLLIKDAACKRCHTIGDSGNFLATNLNISTQEKDIKTLTNAIKNPFLYMPQFNFTKEQIVYIINGLLYNAFYNKSHTGGYITVHFDINGERKNIFTSKCGKCHKVILKQIGPLGEGERGPNLSGLFTNEYRSLQEVEGWNKKTFKKWLKNPRKIKKNALMPVIKLKSDELEDIVKIF
jgi:mono/diheme cytochrome c family protein